MTEKLNTKEEKLDIRAFNYGYQDDVDPHLEFFYKPRNLTFLVAFISGLVYIAMFVLKDDQVFNTKVGLWTAFSFLLVTGLLQFKDGPFIRPHPALWRIVMVFGVAYEMCLVIVLFQNKDHARQLFKFIDPTLGVPLPEKSYGDACELTWTNVWDQTDIFVLAHTFGWFAKALVFMIRSLDYGRIAGQLAWDLVWNEDL
ncbi:hypothetical protein HDV02_003529 [Globomyces sp. JEL0801]|nr:hypothetical protein HDV02_003529 [Globomyces sp. JEL0801]